jgi:hypothetical protein
MQLTSMYSLLIIDLPRGTPCIIHHDGEHVLAMQKTVEMNGVGSPVPLPSLADGRDGLLAAAPLLSACQTYQRRDRASRAR